MAFYKNPDNASKLRCNNLLLKGCFYTPKAIKGILNRFEFIFGDETQPPEKALVDFLKLKGITPE